MFFVDVVFVEILRRMAASSSSSKPWGRLITLGGGVRTSAGNGRGFDS